MTHYSVYNLVFAVFTLSLSYWLAGVRNKRRNLLSAARIALLLTVLYYPWDFFAIRLGVWKYPKHPGLKIHEVPLNDLIFIWLCSYLTCVILIAADRWRARSLSHGNAEGKDAGRKDGGDERIGAS